MSGNPGLCAGRDSSNVLAVSFGDGETALGWTRLRAVERHSAAGEDHATGVVPLCERRGGLTMGLLWITMVTGFPTVLVGFEWYKAGLTLPQIMSAAFVSCLILLAYTAPAALLGAISGQTYGLLSRGVFGLWGSRLVSLNLVWIAIGWYGLTAFFLAESLIGLFHWSVPTAVLAAGLAVVMAVNNFFGFTGVANFARYLAAPVLIGWVVYTFARAALGCPASVWSEPHVVAIPQALTMVSSFVIGYGAWGNEADYWRYGKPGLLKTLIPLGVAIAIGQLIFPATGWMMARMTGVTDYSAAVELMNNYAFGGVPLIAAAVLTVAYVAVNDSCLYGIINALESVREMPRQFVVSGIALAGAATAFALSGYARAFESVASLSCIFLPCATVIMMAEHFILARAFGLRADFSRVPSPAELPPARLAAVVALCGGCLAGLITCGLIPGTEGLKVGVPSLQAWLLALGLYLPWRAIEISRQVGEQRRLLDHMLDTAVAAASPLLLAGEKERD